MKHKKHPPIHEIQALTTIKPKAKLGKAKNAKYAKTTIPKAVREQVWLRSFGKTYEHSCQIQWCQNTVSVFDFHVGHDKPESKGGTLDIENLRPICARCNLSMSDNYTIQEWQKLGKGPRPWWQCFCFTCW